MIIDIGLSPFRTVHEPGMRHPTPSPPARGGQRGLKLDATLVVGLGALAATTAALSRTQIIFGITLFLAALLAAVGILRGRQQPLLLVPACLVAVLLAAVAIWRFTGTSIGEASPPKAAPLASYQSQPAIAQPPVVAESAAAPSESPTDTSSPVAADQYLTDQNVFNPTDTLNYGGDTAQVNGEPYPQSIRIYLYFSGDQGHATFVLGHHYTRLKASAGIDDGSGNAFRARLQISSDNRTIFRQDMAKGKMQPIDLDVTGVYSLTFNVLYLGSEDGTAVFGDARVQGGA